MTTTVEVRNRESPLARPVTPPPNLHVSVASPVSAAPALSERVEQKFFILPQRESLAFALLRRTCRAETLYPMGQVNSLYFDTPSLDQHERSVSGEYAKDKIRIRWYGEEYDPHRSNGDAHGGAPGSSGVASAGQAARVWLELKSRRGFASTKQRLSLDVPAAALAYSALPQGIVPGTTLVRTMAGFGFFARGPLCPVVAISYWRYRFVEPQTGFRISIDSHIRSSIVMPGLGRGERALELPGAVVEVKGPVFDLPPSVRLIAEIGSSWTRYSKYSSSLEGHDAARGSESRLWPSGMMSGEPGVLARVRNTAEARGSRSAELTPRFVEDYET
jgi:hypothetical protein